VGIVLRIIERVATVFGLFAAAAMAGRFSSASSCSTAASTIAKSALHGPIPADRA
jgi:hypothetical protein